MENQPISSRRGMTANSFHHITTNLSQAARTGNPHLAVISLVEEIRLGKKSSLLSKISQI
jgi:hypothetical protein